MNGESEEFIKRETCAETDKIPLVSIITVCYNAERDIERTICSVLEQTDTDYEYIIVDGKSTDSTVDIIQKYMADFSRKEVNTKFISEPDTGIFDAMNKGIEMAEGTWINFMNAGDYFYDSSILIRMREYLVRSKADIVYGNCYRYHPFYSYIKVPGSPDLLKRGMEIPHQASFIRRKVQSNHLFSLEYRMAGDHDLFLKLYMRGYGFEYVPILVCVFSLEGASNTRVLEAYKETYIVLSANGVIDLKNVITKLRYMRGYVRCFCETILPINLKWKLKAVKKRFVDKIKNAI